MIVNPPDADNLNEIALRLYFTAWQKLVTIKRDYAESTDDYSSEREDYCDYIRHSQGELQTILVIFAQAIELSLKAKICSVSPYLLLLKSNIKFKSDPKDFEFSDLATLEASELPNAVNSLCETRLSQEFVQRYHQIRLIRNKISHLGSADVELKVDKLLSIMVSQYIELWPKRNWLEDRLNFVSAMRLAFFHDYKYSSPMSDLMFELPYNLEIFSDEQFVALFGYNKAEERFLCYPCYDEANTRILDFNVNE